MSDLYKQLLPKIILAAEKAGNFIRAERARFSYDRVEIKGLNDLVSYVDKTSEQILVDELSKLLPEAGFIVEENTAKAGKALNWIVDPLDGTTNFVHGIPCYAVSIALAEGKDVLAAAVLEVSRNECFWAAKGSGAYLNEKPIHVSGRRNLSESLIATGFPIYNFDRLDSYLNALTQFMKRTHGLRRIGAAAADLCYLACGRVDGFFEYNLHAWDVAAGALIVKEAGGTIADFSGGDNWLFGKEISCSNGLIEREFNEVIRSSFVK